jgi:hypothetical protein
VSTKPTKGRARKRPPPPSWGTLAHGAPPRKPIKRFVPLSQLFEILKIAPGDYVTLALRLTRHWRPDVVVYDDRRKAGQPKKWGNRTLVNEVEAIQAGDRRLSERGAIRLIVENIGFKGPEEAKAKRIDALYSQFKRAKKL